MKRMLKPNYHASSLYDVPLDTLWNNGIRCLVLDLDNTLVAWNVRAFDQKLADWLEYARNIGFALFILSNGGSKRVGIMADQLGLACIANACKPRPSAFLLAASQAGFEPSACAAIGDQLFTDILGANRAGLYSILVDPISEKEFYLTRFSRMMERLFHRPACKKDIK